MLERSEYTFKCLQVNYFPEDFRGHRGQEGMSSGFHLPLLLFSPKLKHTGLRPASLHPSAGAGVSHQLPPSHTGHLQILSCCFCADSNCQGSVCPVLGSHPILGEVLKMPALIIIASPIPTQIAYVRLLLLEDFFFFFLTQLSKQT